MTEKLEKRFQMLVQDWKIIVLQYMNEKTPSKDSVVCKLKESFYGVFFYRP